MKVTFILKDLSEQFYNGGFLTIGLLNLNPLEQYLYLDDKVTRGSLGNCITRKIGHANAFRDVVELNQLRRRGLTAISGKVEPRRGYKLATFELAKPSTT